MTKSALKKTAAYWLPGGAIDTPLMWLDSPWFSLQGARAGFQNQPNASELNLVRS